MRAIALRGGLLVALASQLVAPGYAQTPAPATVATFEAASIRRNVSGETRVRFETPPGRLTAVNVPLRFVIRQAYRVPEARIIGGPGWIDSERFDITATATGANADATREMLRTLLKERSIQIFGVRRRTARAVDPRSSPGACSAGLWWTSSTVR
jgi:hypothetical protein